MKLTALTHNVPLAALLLWGTQLAGAIEACRADAGPKLGSWTDALSEMEALLLFTDGENLQGDVETATTALTAASVGVIGVVAGTERGGPIPETDGRGGVHYKRDSDGQPVVTRAHKEVLEGIADAASGEVVTLGDPGVVGEIAAAVDRLRTREVEATQSVRRIERFPVFLAAAAALLMAGFAFSPWRRMAAAVLAVAREQVADHGNAVDDRDRPVEGRMDRRLAQAESGQTREHEEAQHGHDMARLAQEAMGGVRRRTHGSGPPSTGSVAGLKVEP